MPKKISQAQKRINQANKKRLSNRSRKTTNKTNKKNLIQALQGQQPELITACFKNLQSSLDRSARLGVIHKNKAARLKSIFAHQMKKHPLGSENPSSVISDPQ